MLQQYKILTVTHRHTNLKNISQFALNADNQADETTVLEAIKLKFELEELYYVATCNRVLFLFSTENKLDSRFVERFFHAVNAALPTALIEQNVQALEGLAAVEHFFKVGGSIDSLVVGERQILGQLREAFDQALSRGHIGNALRLLFQKMVAASKDIYGNTRIGEKPVSIASLAVRKMLRSQLTKESRVLIVGAGQTNILVGKFLLKHNFKEVVVFNRSLDKARQLAAKFSGEAYPLSDLSNYRGGFDCLLVCTGSKEPVVTPEIFTSLLNKESADTKVIVDLAIPHNTASEVFLHYPEVTYIEIEGLRQLADENRSFREQELIIAEQRLQEHITSFPNVFQHRQLEIAMKEVPTAIKAVRAKAVNEVFRKDIEQLDDKSRAILDEVLAYMEKKCIGIPMRVARESLSN